MKAKKSSEMVFIPFSMSFSILSENSKRFLFDWTAAAATFLAQTISVPVTMLFKAECVTCKCTGACSAEQFTKTIFGVTPSGLFSYSIFLFLYSYWLCRKFWLSILCTSNKSCFFSGLVEKDLKGHSVYYFRHERAPE